MRLIIYSLCNKPNYLIIIDDRKFAGSSLFVALTLVDVDVAEPVSDR